MESLYKDFEKAIQLIKKYQNILIISHRNPDGDTIGANLVLNEVFKSKLKKNVISACADPIPYSLLFLVKGNSIKREIDLKNTELIITVDCSSKNQIKYEELFNKKIPIINIDHHPSNSNYGKVNIVDSDAASTTEIVFDFLKFIEASITPYHATCLLAGIYCDTGSFMHSNTKAKTYKMASILLESGASVSSIIKNMFQTKTIEQLRLWGKVLSNTRINKNGTVVSKVTTNDFDETKALPSDLSGIVNYLNSIPESKMSILLSEDMKGNVKGSVRSGKGNVDASTICEQLGGGGHKKAAGFTIPGKIVSNEVWRIEK